MLALAGDNGVQSARLPASFSQGEATGRRVTDCDHHHEQQAGVKRLLAAFAVITVFMVVEIVGGLISGSLALIADAAHMFTDSVALGLAASAHLIARRPADDRRHFGYRRAQVLAAFVNGVFLMILLAWIVFEAVMRFLNPIDIEAGTMLGVAVLGLGANVVAFFILHTAHSRDLNIRGAMLHVVSDLLGSVAAIVAALIIMQWGFTRIDPLLSVLVAALIGVSAVRLIRETGHILLEGAPEHIDVEALVRDLKAAAPNVLDIHDVRIWQLTTDHTSLSLHARIADPDDAAAALNDIKSRLEQTYGISQSTIQIETGEDCPDCDPDGPSPAAAGFAARRTDKPAHGERVSPGSAVFAGPK